MFGYWADDSIRSNGQIQAVEISLIGHSPEIVGDANPNVMVVRRSALDNAMIEVEVDGMVVNTYTETMLHSVTLNGMGGDDTFIVDTSNGELEFAGGVEIIGDGDDTFVASTVENTTWEMGLDGEGQAAIGNDFPPPCDEPHPDEQIINLNFEADSLWFDDTAYNQNGYATFGDALRGELQLYFDNTIIPLFDGSFTVTLDITDNEVDSLATSEAFGYGFHDLNGENVWAASPWSIMTGRGDSNGVDESDGLINYNLDLSRFGGDQQALLDNITGGLTRSQYFRVLGMESFIPNETQSFDPRGNRDIASVMDLQYRDLNDAAVVGNYDANDSTYEVLSYVTNANWAGDGSGLYFLGESDTGAPMPLPVNSNTELIDFDTIASSLAGTSRDGSFNDIVEQDRAFLRGMGFSLNPVNPPELSPGFDVVFTGIDEVQAGDGTDYICIGSSNIDLMISSGLGNDTFNVTGLGVGALNLFGEGGDDTYEVVFSSSGVITIIDSVGTENDTLIGKGTSIADEFIFDVNGVKVNSGLLIYVGIENATFDGLGDDDVFEVKAEQYGIIGLTGGEGVDTFIDSSGLDQQLAISVDDPVADPVDRLRLDLTGSFVDAYTADEVERFVVDGTFMVDGVNGTPTVAGGLNLIGDGDETLVVESALDAGWMITGDGAGDLTMDVEPLIFSGISNITGTTGVNTVGVTNTSTDLEITTRDGADVFNIENVGTGIVTVNSGDADDVFNIINSGGGVMLSGEAGDDQFNVSDIGSGELMLSGDEGGDSFLVTALGTGDLTIDAGVDADTITIDDSSGSAAAILAMAGDGNDEFFVEGTGVGVIELQGQAGDDTYYVNSVDPAADFSIVDSVNAENDKLVATGTEFDDVFDIGGDTETAIINGHQWSIIGIEEYSIDGLGGDDVFNVTTTDMFTGVINLSGNDGDDTFVVNESGSGEVNLNGDAGDDTYTVFFKPNTNVTITDSVGSENDRFFGFGTENADVFEIDQNAPVVNGGMVVMTGVESEEYDGLGADDTFNVHSTIGDSLFKGGDDADTFNIDMTSDGNVFMGQAGTDIFNVATSSGDAEFYGGDGVDGFFVAETTGNGEFFGGNDADYFSINLATGVSKFFGEAGEDLFDIANHGPMGASGAIEVDGGTERNRLEVLGYQTKTNMVVVSKDRITGMSAVPIVYSASGSFSVENGVGGIELTGSDNHADGFNVNNLLPNHTLNMIGGGGNDRFTVSQGALGGVSADGEEGSDLYQYSMGSNNNRFLFALDSGVIGSDRLIAYLTNGDDTLSLSGEAFAVQTDNLMFNGNYESLFVSARGGNDEITVNSVPVNFVRIIGGDGDDIIDVNNYEQVGSLLVNGDAGNDIIDIDSGTLSGNFTAFGGTGDDSFLVSKASYGDAYIDGQEGSDSYEIEIADRSSRLVVARDSGVVGTDTLDVYGTVVGDFVTFRSGVMLTPQQSILYTDKTETMNLFTEGLDDNVTVYGLSSPVTNIMTEAGKDLVHVRSSFGPATSKVLNIDTGSNDDYVIVSGVGADTTTTINTGVGNDNVTLGSSLSANVGNLNDLYGTVDIAMGLGNDRIYMNDVGKVASADYEVGAGFLRSTPGGPNSFFAGITYDNTVETLRLDTTNYRNEVTVTPSSSTAFSFFGGGGLNIIELTGDADDDGRQFFGEDGGVGSWRFSDGSRDIFFSDYFIG